MTVTIESETEVPFDFEYEQTARSHCTGNGFGGFPYEAEVNLLLVDNDIIHELNLEHPGVAGQLICYSFPMLVPQEAEDFSAIGEEQEWNCNPDTGEILLGDIIISVPKVLEQAKVHGHSPKEKCFLITHSIYHLFGYVVWRRKKRTIMENKREKF